MEKYFLMGGALVALVGAGTDLRSARIPNRLTYNALVAGLGLRAAVLGFPGLKSGAAGILVAGSLFLLLFVLGAMGGGDVKLMTAVAAWVGSSHVVTLLLAAALAGGVLLRLHHHLLSAVGGGESRLSIGAARSAVSGIADALV